MLKSITIEPGHRRFPCEPGETLLDAALRGRIGVPFGCRNGTCGSCRATVIEGEYESLSRSPLDAVLLCQTRPLTDMSLEAPNCRFVEPVKTRQLPARIIELRWIDDEVAVLRLRLPPSEKFHFESGQYIAIVMLDGSRKSFSLARPCTSDNTLELHIRRIPGGQFTDRHLQSLKVGDRVRIEGPFGTFSYVGGERGSIILLAGGTGYAPIQALLLTMAAQGVPNPVHLYWGMREAQHFYAEPEALAAASGLADLKVVRVLSEPDPHWTGRNGLVHEAVLADFPDLRDVDVYVCGSPVLIEAARRDFVFGRNLDPQRFFFDAFGPIAMPV